ncbi:MAG TPA: LCP family protein [Clostridia bacterium]
MATCFKAASLYHNGFDALHVDGGVTVKSNQKLSVSNGQNIREKKYMKGRRKRSTRGIIILGAVLFLALTSTIGAAALYYNHLLNKISYIQPHQESFDPNLKPGDLNDPTDPTETPTPRITESGETTTAAPATTPATTVDWASKYDVSGVPVMSDPNVQNILLIGSDSNSSMDYSRSDTNIIVSINKKAGTLRMVSILRDTGVIIPGRTDGVDKINHSYSYGGPRLLMDTIEANFRIHIDNYIAVGFTGFASIISSIGGLDIELTADEAKEMGLKPGLQHLDGTYTEWYVRLRKFDSDFQRTTRQRHVLELVMQKARGMSVVGLPSLLEKILPQVSTGLTRGEMSSLLLSAPSMLKYPLTQSSLPVSGTYISIDYTFYFNDLMANVRHIQQFLYNR